MTKTTEKEAIKQFHEEYLLQQGIYDLTQHCDLDHELMKLLWEDERTWVVLYDNSLDRAGKFLNIIWKRKPEKYIPCKMQTIEL